VEMLIDAAHMWGYLFSYQIRVVGSVDTNKWAEWPYSSWLQYYFQNLKIMSFGEIHGLQDEYRALFLEPESKEV
jgi:hypothetical protein